jgi:hypothetical protein
MYFIIQFLLLIQKSQNIRGAIAVFQNLKTSIKLILIMQGFLISNSSLLVQKVLANPVELSSITTAEKSVSSCNRVIPTLNVITPTESSLEEDQPLPAPTSACASDLEILSSTPNTLVSQKFLPPPESVSPPEVPEPLQIPTAEDSDRWKFVFQPYATIPITTYGSATVKGQTVDYSLSLGRILQYLSVTASGRVEAWKGNWGFIIYGYYVNLNAINSVQRTNSRTPSPINAVDYVLTKGINTNVQQVANQLDQQVQVLKQQELLWLTALQVVQVLTPTFNHT